MESMGRLQDVHVQHFLFVFDVTSSFRFRFLFVRRSGDRNLRVSSLSLMPYSGGPPLYLDSLFCDFFSLVDRQRQREGLRRVVFDTIRQYRDEGRPFETHNSLTPLSWSVLSFPISPVGCFQYYRELEAFMQDHSDQHGTAFIHGTVFIPFKTVLHENLRLTVYRMLYFNTPYSFLIHFVRTIRFRLLFVASTALGDRIRIERLRVTNEHSDTLYQGTQRLSES